MLLTKVVGKEKKVVSPFDGTQFGCYDDAVVSKTGKRLRLLRSMWALAHRAKRGGVFSITQWRPIHPRGGEEEA